MNVMNDKNQLKNIFVESFFKKTQKRMEQSLKNTEERAF